ncbi:MAG: diaminopimelate epimerase [Lachnospiraceae bacterium]|nr:diaminopimelate epimerase [Lachnospiraceae bacterium]
MIRFTKMHGCGNDYVYINGFTEKIENHAEAAVKLSDRHFGIGSDGLIFINPSDKADFEMEMYNMDGSRAQMCGNGIRCVGKYVYDHGMTEKTVITVDTLAGIKTLNMKVTNGKVSEVTVDMGEPILIPSKIPVSDEFACDKEKVVNEIIEVEGNEYHVTCVSMGNPHAVVFIDHDESDLKLSTIGPLFENHKAFPERINTEFVRVRNRKNLDMRVWERGSGETFACGTGACASAVAAILNGLTEDEVTIKLQGGDLKVHWDRDNRHVYMTGPAETVFEGEIEKMSDPMENFPQR